MGGMPEWDGERMPAATCPHNHGPDTRMGCPNGQDKGLDARTGRMRVLYLATQKREAGIDTCPTAPSQKKKTGKGAVGPRTYTYNPRTGCQVEGPNPPGSTVVKPTPAVEGRSWL